MKVIAVEWRSLGQIGQSVGIVLTENSTGEISCRIGLCQFENSEIDSKEIMLQGGKLHMDEALGFFPQHTKAILLKWKK